MPALQQRKGFGGNLCHVFRGFRNHIKLLQFFYVISQLVRHKGQGDFRLYGSCPHAAPGGDQGRGIILADAYDPQLLGDPPEGGVKGHAHHIGGPKKGYGAAFCDNTGIIGAVIIILGKIFSLYQRVRAGILQPGGASAHADIKIPFRALRRSPCAKRWGHAFYMVHMFHNCVKIRLVKRYGGVFPCTVHIKGNLPAAHGFQLRIDLSPDAVANGNYHDHGGYSDDNAQHGKNGASFIASDIHQGNLDVFPNLCHFFLVSALLLWKNLLQLILSHIPGSRKAPGQGALKPSLSLRWLWPDGRLFGYWGIAITVMPSTSAGVTSKTTCSPSPRPSVTCTIVSEEIPVTTGFFTRMPFSTT